MSDTLRKYNTKIYNMMNASSKLKYDMLTIKKQRLFLAQFKDKRPNLFMAWLLSIVGLSMFVLIPHKPMKAFLITVFYYLTFFWVLHFIAFTLYSAFTGRWFIKRYDRYLAEFLLDKM